MRTSFTPLLNASTLQTDVKNLGTQFLDHSRPMYHVYICMLLLCHIRVSEWSRHHFWNLSGSYGIRTHKHLVHKQRVWLNGWVFIYELSGCGFKSCCCQMFISPENIRKPMFSRGMEREHWLMDPWRKRWKTKSVIMTDKQFTDLIKRVKILDPCKRRHSKVLLQEAEEKI